MALFDGPTIEFDDTRRDYGERRTIALGAVAGRELVCVFTIRGSTEDPTRWIISLRKANKGESNAYRTAFPTPPPDHTEGRGASNMATSTGNTLIARGNRFRVHCLAGGGWRIGFTTRLGYRDFPAGDPPRAVQRSRLGLVSPKCNTLMQTAVG